MTILWCDYVDLLKIFNFLRFDRKFRVKIVIGASRIQTGFSIFTKFLFSFNLTENFEYRLLQITNLASPIFWLRIYDFFCNEIYLYSGNFWKVKRFGQANTKIGAKINFKFNWNAVISRNFYLLPENFWKVKCYVLSNSRIQK